MASIFNFQSTFPSSREGYLEAFIVERVDLGLAPIGFSANRSAVSAILLSKTPSARTTAHLQALLELSAHLVIAEPHML